MATTPLKICTPCLSIGREAAIASRSNSSAAAAASCRGSFGVEKTFVRGEPAPVLRSLKTSSFGRSSREWGNSSARSSRAPQMQSLQTVHATEKLPANVEMLEAYEIEEKVRDYELDHYGVVNNAIYAQYCQHARHELLEHVGFSPDAVAASGNSMAITDMTLKYFAPLKSGDRYIVSSRVAGTTLAGLYFEDNVYKLPKRELVMSAKATVVILDKNYRPTRITDEVKVKLLRYKVRTSNDFLGGTSNLHIDGNSTNSHINGKLATQTFMSTATQQMIRSILTQLVTSTGAKMVMSMGAQRMVAALITNGNSNAHFICKSTNRRANRHVNVNSNGPIDKEELKRSCQ